MKQKISSRLRTESSTASGRILILHWLRRISIAVLICTVRISAQQGQQTPPEFPLGTWATGAPEDEPNQYTAIENAGFNWVVQGVYPSNKSMLQNFNIITQNSKAGEWVYHYSNGKYKRWEAGRDEFAFLVTGFKHPHDNWNQNKGYLYGQVEEYLGAACWATTESNPFPVDSVLLGPNYTQDKKYKSLDPVYDGKPIKYTVIYRLALTNAPEPTDTVCKLYVRYRFALKENGQVVEIKEEIFDSLYLTAADLPGETFHVKSLNGYIYPVQYRDQTVSQRWSNPNLSGTYYEDIDTLMGIEYCVKWYGHGKLYIDYVEVFDDDNLPYNQGIWKQWLDDPGDVATKIDLFLSTYSEWSNIRYWYVIDEPGSLDAFEPIRIIDSLVYKASGRRVITQFHPNWNGYWNGDISVQKFVELTGTDRVMMDYFPFWENETAEYGFTYIRPVLQLTAEYSPNFYYVPQGFGQFIVGPPYFQTPCGWREPDSIELKASIFLALAHGAKGMLSWNHKK